MVGLDLFEVFDRDLSIPIKLRELVSKLVWTEIPVVVSTFDLDLEILLDQALSVTKLKRSYASLVEENYDALS